MQNFAYKTKEVLGIKDKTVPVNLLPDATFEVNIGTPLTGKTAENVRIRVAKEVQMLQKLKGVKVSAVREGEVIRFVFPASVLFEPNDTVVWKRASLALRPLLRYMTEPDYNLMIVAGYMDDTGKPEYTQKISDARARAISRWFGGEGVKESSRMSYAFGSEHPVVENNSDYHRSQNRRIEIFLIPGTVMIEKARKGKLD